MRIWIYRVTRAAAFIGATYALLHAALFYVLVGALKIPIQLQTGIEGSQTGNLVLVSILCGLISRDLEARISTTAGDTLDFVGVLVGLGIFTAGVVLHLGART